MNLMQMRHMAQFKCQNKATPKMDNFIEERIVEGGIAEVDSGCIVLSLNNFWRCGGDYQDCESIEADNPETKLSNNVVWAGICPKRKNAINMAHHINTKNQPKAHFPTNVAPNVGKKECGCVVPKQIMVMLWKRC
jgi:hypothetical protein